LRRDSNLFFFALIPRPLGGGVVHCFKRQFNDMVGNNERCNILIKRQLSFRIIRNIFLIAILLLTDGFSQGLSSAIGKSDTLGMSKVMVYIKGAFPLTIREQKDSSGDFIALPYPYNSPSIKGVFEQLYYWDTYFINLGLLRTGMVEQANNNVNDLLFLVNKVGLVPNASLKSTCNRSQTPFLAMMVQDVYDKTNDTEWLKEAYVTLQKEYSFWMTQRLSPVGLNRPHNSATEDYLLFFYDYLKSDRFKGLEFKTREEKLAFSSNALSEAEIWDFTPRFDRRCEDFCPVDANSNLYLYEKILARFSKTLNNGKEQYWQKKSEKRKKLIQKYLWNEKLGCYTDYDFVNKMKGDLASCATLFPLMAGIATPKQAKLVVQKMKDLLEFDNGLSTCEKRPEKFVYQWDYPNAWPPLQCIAVQALNNYGFKDEAQKIAMKYVRTVIKNYDKTGTLWEKYNALDGTTTVANEYQMPSMLGWTAGVFVFAEDYLTGCNK